MSNQVSQLGLAVDTSGVKKATGDLKEFASAGVLTQTKAQAAADGINKVDKAASSVSIAVDKAVAALKLQVETLGMSSQEAQRYTLAKSNATAAQLAEVQAAHAAISAYDEKTRKTQEATEAETRSAAVVRMKQAAVKGSLDTLREEISTFGMSSDALQLRALRLTDATQREITYATAMQNRLAALREAAAKEAAAAAAAQANAAIAKANAAAIASSVAALQQQSATVGMTGSELELYRLRLAGASQEQLAAAKTAMLAVSAYQAKAAAARDAMQAEQANEAAVSSSMAAMRGEVATLGMSSDAIQLRNLQLQGASRTELAAAAAMQRKIAAHQESTQKDAAATAATRANATSVQSLVTALQQEQATLGMTSAELQAYKLRLQGATDAQIKAAEASRASIAAYRAGAAGLGQVGMSAQATAAAMRMVPAQFTDIAVSLASGQPPFMVMMQQGGQLKDMFGGLGPAAKALGGYVAGLISPFTLTAAAAAAAYFAFEQGRQEVTSLQLALVKTNGTLGVTSDQLRGMADAAARMSNTTKGEAVSALTELAATGQVAGTNLQRFTAIAVDLERYGGQSVQKTADIFTRLAQEPSQAVLSLNSSMHFLTASLYEQIVALEEQGRKTEAASLAQQAYADAVVPQITTIKSNLGLLETAWYNTKSAATGAWDAMRGLGRTDVNAGIVGTFDTLVGNVKSKLGGIFGGTINPQIAAANAAAEDAFKLLDEKRQVADQEAAAERAKKQAAQEAAIAAGKEINTIQLKGLSTEQQRVKQLEAYRANLEKIRAANPTSPLLAPEAVARGEKAIIDGTKDKAGESAAKKLAAEKKRAEEKAAREIQQTLDKDLRGGLDAQKGVVSDAKDTYNFALQEAQLYRSADLTSQEQYLAKTKAAREQYTSSTVAALDAEKELLTLRALETTDASKRVEIDNELNRLSRERTSLMREMQQAESAEKLKERVDTEKRVRALLAETDPYEKHKQDLKAINDLWGDAERGTARYAKAVAKADLELNKSLAKQRKEMGTTVEYADIAGSSIGNALGPGVDALVSANWKDLGKLVETTTMNMMKQAIVAQMQIALLGSTNSSNQGGGLLGMAAGVISGWFGAGSTAGDTSAFARDGSSYLFNMPSATGRADGGSFGKGQLFPVNERGTELLTMNGKDYLMSGSDGYITSAERLAADAVGNASASSAAAVRAPVVNLSVTVNGSEKYEASQTTSQDSNGDIFVDLVLSKFESRISNGGNSTTAALESAYGLNRGAGAIA